MRVEDQALIDRLLTYADNCAADKMPQQEDDLREAAAMIIGTKSANAKLRSQLVKKNAALEEISKCAICGFVLHGNESFDDLATLISGFNSALQKRVQIARDALIDDLRK